MPLLVLDDFCFGELDGSAGSPVAAVLAGGAMTAILLAMAELAILIENAARLASRTGSVHKFSSQAVGELLRIISEAALKQKAHPILSYGKSSFLRQSLLFIQTVEALVLSSQMVT